MSPIKQVEVTLVGADVVVRVRHCDMNHAMMSFDIIAKAVGTSTDRVSIDVTARVGAIILHEKDVAG